MLSKTNCPLLSLCWPQMNLWVSAHEKRSLSSHSGLLRLKSLWVETIEYGTSEVSVLHALKKVSLLFFSKTWKKRRINRSVWPASQDSHDSTHFSETSAPSSIITVGEQDVLSQSDLHGTSSGVSICSSYCFHLYCIYISLALFICNKTTLVWC